MKKRGLAIVLAAALLAGCGGNEGKEPAETAGASASGTGAPSSQPAQTEAANAAQEVRYEAGQIRQALLDGDYENVYAQFTEDFQKEISLSDFREAVQSFSEGVETWVPHTGFEVNGGQYVTWKDQGGKRGLIVTMDDGNRISGLRLVNVGSFPETDKAKTKLAYGLPFKGEWFVFWGGANVLANYHYEFESQRYAYDFIQVKDGYSYKGDPARNESYYAFGQEVVAPQDGKVVQVVNDVEDNEPVGAMNERQPAGNMVVIDHGNGEYSVLAHLKKGSVTVNVGDRVSKGDPIGLCGNSGNSSEPHLHYQVSDSPDPFAGKSVRVQWEDGLELVQGDAAKGR